MSASNRVRNGTLDMIIQLLFIVLLSHFTTGCPENPVPPCTCRLIGYHSSIITCTGVENERDLENSLHSMKNTSVPVKTVEIFEASLNFLPSKVFKGLRFQKLFIAGSSMVALSDEEMAFVGLEDSLEILLVHECTLFSGWNWSHLKNLRALTELQTTKAGPVEVDDDVKEIAHLNITNLFFTQESISYIHETAFATFHNLKTLSLKQNLIRELKRSMFPNPALQLEQVIFSYNELQYLPRDIFTNMPKLRSILLSGNSILTIEQATFSPVWNNLYKLDLRDNPIRCDCRLKWLLMMKFPLNTWLKCAEPLTLKGKEIKELKPNEVYC